MPTFTVLQAAGIRNQFFDEIQGAVDHNPEIAQYQSKATDDITPADALDLFRRVPDEDLPLLWLNADMSRPERLILTHLPVPPVCIRPSVKMDDGASNEDDLTCKLSSIVTTSNSIREHMLRGQSYETTLATWDSLNLEVAQYINGALPNSIKLKDQKPMKGTRSSQHSVSLSFRCAASVVTFFTPFCTIIRPVPTPQR